MSQERDQENVVTDVFYLEDQGRKQRIKKIAIDNITTKPVCPMCQRCYLIDVFAYIFEPKKNEDGLETFIELEQKYCPNCDWIGLPKDERTSMQGRIEA